MRGYFSIQEPVRCLINYDDLGVSLRTYFDVKRTACTGTFVCGAKIILYIECNNPVVNSYVVDSFASMSSSIVPNVCENIIRKTVAYFSHFSDPSFLAS